MSNKERLLGEIRKIDGLLLKLVSQLNTFDAILTLMSYLEILDNEHHALRRNMLQEKERAGLFLLLTERNIVLNTAIIRECIEYLYSISNNRKTLSKIPPMESLVIEGDANDLETFRWVQENYESGIDKGLVMPTQLLGHFNATRIVIWKGYYQTIGKEQISTTFEFLRYFNIKKAMGSLIRFNIEADISSDWSKIDLHDLSPEEILKRENIHPRVLRAGTVEHFPQWKSEVIDVNEETLLSTELEAVSPKQKEMFAREHRMFFSQFAAIPGFSDRFQQVTKVSLGNYCEITLALQRIALDLDPPVVFLPKNKVIRKAKQKSGCSDAEIIKILDMFTCRTGDNMENKRFLFDGQNYIFTWSMIAIPFHRYVESIYRDFIDGNFQGLEFEKECRNLLFGNSYSVLDGRLEITDQIIPDNVSMRLWGKIKKRTDIDVVGVKGNCILIIECKSELQRLKRKSTQLNMFGKYYEELLCKSEWIANNIHKFRKELKNKNFNLPENVSLVLPVLVSAFIEPYTHANIVSIKELDTILCRIPTEITGPQLEVSLESNTTFTLPVFKIPT